MLAFPNLDPETYQWLRFVVAVVIGWEVLKRVWGKLIATVSKSKGGSTEAKDGWLLTQEEFPELSAQVPAHPHVEMAMDPPTGVLCSNSPSGHRFENDMCSGSFLYFHAPTAPGVDQAYGDYFEGKKRRWELRLNFRFKVAPPPDAELCFGIELDSYVPMSATTKHVVSIAVAAIRSAVGGAYQTHGDDPETCLGEIEKPCCVLPLWAFDQFVVTPEGQEAPSLNDPNFSNLGKRRYQRMREFVKELETMKQSFDTRSTYTFSFWGNSRFLDVINWQLMGIPMVTPLDFEKLVGRPPVYAVLYHLHPDLEDTAGGRHIQSRKKYYFRAATWSSERRPDKQRFEALSGSSLIGEPMMERMPDKSSLRRRMTGFLTKHLACCVASRERSDSDKPPSRL